MTTLSSWLQRRGVRHALVWGAVVALVGLLALLDAADPEQTAQKVRRMAVLLPVAAAAIYAHFWALRELLQPRRYLAYQVATVGILLIGAWLLVMANQVAGVELEMPDDRNPTFAYLLGLAAGNLTLAVLLATCAHYVRRGLVAPAQLQKLHALQLETELSLLKAQVNQHFLFNTLNNLYGLSLGSPDQMPEALLQLAGLMRYQLDSSRQAQVTVGTEAEYLSNYMGLEKLRLRQNTQVEFVTELQHPEQPIAPLLLLPLVENCFKHAIGPSGSHNTIFVRLTQTDSTLTLFTENTIPPYFRPAPSGLGLPNLQARLAQLYPQGRHQLALNATVTHYTATLTLQL